jgi:MFS family permease
MDPTADPPSQSEYEELTRPASASPTEAVLETEMPGGVSAAGHDPYAALRFPGFVLYMVGWVVSVIGQQVQSVAVQWQIYQRIGTPSKGSLALGIVGGVQALPVILLALPAGHLADRRDRRKIIALSQLGAAVCSLGLAAVSHYDGSIGLLYLLLFLGATAQAVGWPARSALMPQLVPDGIFANAATWNSSAFQVAAVAGPALGGLVVSWRLMGPTGAYALDAACALAFCLLMSGVRGRPSERSREPASLATLLAGARFVWKTKVILGAITLDLFAVLLGGAIYLLPVFAHDVLHVGAVGFGWLRAAPAIGAFVVAIVIAHRPPMKKAGAAMLWSVAGFGAATVVFAFSRSFFLSLAALAVTGAVDNVSVVVRHTLVQMLPPERMRGRVSAVNNVFIGASNEIGGLESGVSAWLFGLAWGAVGGAIASVAIGGIGSILVVAAVAMLFKPLRQFGALADARPLEELPGA